MGLIRTVTPRPVRAAVAEQLQTRLPEGTRRRKYAGDAITITGLAATAAGIVVGGKKGAALRFLGQIADDLDGIRSMISKKI